jgi:hypothetical protein
VCIWCLLPCRLLNTFQSTLDEVSIIALPAQHSTAGTVGQAAAQRCVKLQSFYDPAKGTPPQHRPWLYPRTCLHAAAVIWLSMLMHCMLSRQAVLRPRTRGITQHTAVYVCGHVYGGQFNIPPPPPRRQIQLVQVAGTALDASQAHPS